MELPQPRGSKPTHDFLSLYSSPTTPHLHQDPSPSQGGYLKTHDFLQPLEEVEKSVNSAIEEKKKGVVRSVENLLPGGIGTYNVSFLNQRISKSDIQATSTSRIDDNSNYNGSGFTLWDETSMPKGKTGKENIAAHTHLLPEADVSGQWSSLLVKPAQSSFSYKHNTSSFSSFSSSQPLSSHKNQSFMEMITSARNSHGDDDDDDNDDEDDGDKFVVKKEASPLPKGNLSVKVEAKTMDQKPNTPRSKHSATEQRRRSKINDRFQKLREIIPNSDQKRDKASFLLEVIDYIQFLQEKINRYESSYYNGWNHEPSKMMHLKKSNIAEGLVEQTQRGTSGCGAATVFGRKLGGNRGYGLPSLSIDGRNLVESNVSTTKTIKERVFTCNAEQTQANIFSFAKTSMAMAPPVTPQQQPQSDRDRTMMGTAAHKMKDEELVVKRGTINISSVYSQRLLNTLTQALQTSGVDLSEASISVQIDLRKRANRDDDDDDDDNDNDNDDLRHSRAGEECDHNVKRLRTS